MIKPGTYAAVVAVQNVTDVGELACQFGHSKPNTQTGEASPFVIVKFAIIRGEFARQSISWWGYFTEKTEANTLKSLRACGFTGDDVDKFPDQRPDQEVELVIQMKPGFGDKPARPEVRWVNAVNRGIKLDAPIAGADLRKFGATLKTKLKSIPAVSGPKAVFDESKAAGEPEGDGWSGNDSPDPPPTDLDFGNSPGAPLGDDNIPF